MQRPDPPAFEVGNTAEGIEQGPGVSTGQRQSHGVDRKVSASQVRINRRRRHGRQRTGREVTLGPGAGQIDTRAVGERRAGGTESLVDNWSLDRCLSQGRDERIDGPVDGQVDVQRLRWAAVQSEQDVSDQTSDDEERFVALRCEMT